MNDVLGIPFTSFGGNGHQRSGSHSQGLWCRFVPRRPIIISYRCRPASGCLASLATASHTGITGRPPSSLYVRLGADGQTIGRMLGWSNGK